MAKALRPIETVQEKAVVDRVVDDRQVVVSDCPRDLDSRETQQIQIWPGLCAEGK